MAKSIELLITTNRLCILCSEEKNILCFYYKTSDGEFYNKNKCNDCRNKRRRIKRRKPKLRPDPSEGYRTCLKCDINKLIEEFPDKSKVKKPYASNTCRKCHNKVRNEKRTAREKNDPLAKLRSLISATILRALKGQSSTKNGESCLKYLPFSIKELKDYLESQFNLPGNEWMNWKNHGAYNLKTWKDDDKNTWCWNIDHIIPQSILPYIGMSDENFKKCWSLNNLRPLSAKQNILEGVSRIRHK